MARRTKLEKFLTRYGYRDKPPGWTEKNNIFYFSDLKSIEQLNKIIRLWKSGKNNVSFDEVTYCYPNIAIPLAVEAKISKAKRKPASSNCRMDFDSIFTPTNPEDVTNMNVLNRVISFKDTHELNLIANMITERIIGEVPHDKGNTLGDLFTTADNTLAEIMGNVITHAKIDNGYIMTNLEKSNKRLHVCIGDGGIGIRESLRSSTEISEERKPKNSQQAIAMAIERGVTRSQDEGAGNGLWLLHRTIEVNRGGLTIVSDGSGYSYFWDELEDKFNSKIFKTNTINNGRTIVDFQLRFDKPISIDDIYQSGHTESPYVYTISDKATGFIECKVIKYAASTRTRQDAQALLHALFNLKSMDDSVIMINFENIETIPSSYADEIFHALIDRYGIAGTMANFVIINASDTVLKSINSAIRTRYKM